MRSCVSFCDYFVICSGDSSRQVRAIADSIDSGLKEFGLKVWHQQGIKELGRNSSSSSDSESQGAWVLLDIGDVVAHILEPGARDFYELEYLWRDAKKLDWRR